jgi:serine protease
MKNLVLYVFAVLFFTHAGFAAAVDLPSRSGTVDSLILKFKPTAKSSENSTAKIIDDARISAFSNLLLSASGSTLSLKRLMQKDLALAQLPSRMSHAQAQVYAENLVAENGQTLAYAAPNGRIKIANNIAVKPTLTPNDPDLARQWYLLNGTGGINASDAWNITTGSAQTIVAVLDTGVLPHNQLAGRLLPGYDFISPDSDGGFRRANDGDGRDADQTDPGDFATADEAKFIDFIKDECTASNSSWHGTSVSGIIASNANDGVGVAGIDWKAKILPVRVLGKCGGTDADLVDALAWTAGLDVPGIQRNQNPAQIINLSLGDKGACPVAYRDVFERVLAAGVRAIVVAAGNEREDVSKHFPANCPGVISVASSNTRGNLSGYSNFGAVSLAAPGGDSAEGILFYTIANSGASRAGADSYSSRQGTSFSAPVVAGIVSLMLAANPALTATEIRAILQATAKPFPAGATCNTSNCGAGIANAANAVALAANIAKDATLTVAQRNAANAPAADLNDMWFNPAESGWGMSVVQHVSKNLFAVWYTYEQISATDLSTRPLWLVMPGGTWRSPNVFSTNIYRTTGSYFSKPFDPAELKVNLYGEATLVFQDANKLTLHYQLNNGLSGTKNLNRQPF